MAATKKTTTKKKARARKSELLTQVGTLRGHTDLIFRLGWSRDGKYLATPSKDRTTRIWRVSDGECLKVLEGHLHGVNQASWSPDGKQLATCSFDRTIRIWDVASGECQQVLRDHADDVCTVAWSPGGKLVVSGSADGTLILWDAVTWSIRSSVQAKSLRKMNRAEWSGKGDLLIVASDVGGVMSYSADLTVMVDATGVSTEVKGLAWHPNHSRFACSYDDGSIFVGTIAEDQVYALNGHSRLTSSVSFSSDGTLLASKSWDNTVRIWDLAKRVTIATFPEPSGLYWPSSLAFSPVDPLLATLGDRDKSVRLWNVESLLAKKAKPVEKTLRYSNAKVVLVGDSGVGKTALGNALMQQHFAPTASTHGRTVWTLSSGDVTAGRVTETREVMLWDLAGQPGYRIFHRQHLDEVAVALVLFDARDETDPFSGARYWARVLDEAARGFPLVKFLVSSRIDRGGVAVSQARIDDFLRAYGFAGYFETSAKAGIGVDELRKRTLDAIAWDKIPSISAPEVFHAIRTFLIGEKEQGRLLLTSDELLKRFEAASAKKSESNELQAAFDNCLARLGTAGLVRPLRFGNLVLLQPELLDHYVAWMAHAAREEPDGAGFLFESDAKAGSFRMDDDRLLAKRKSDEALVLTAAVEEVVARSIALRENTDKGAALVFPSELRAESPYPGGYHRILSFLFDGPVSAIYATLTVRLLNSLAFQKRQLFKNAAIFAAPREQVCGIAVAYPEDGNIARGRLTVFSGPHVERDVKLLLMRYVEQQLSRLALSGSVVREAVTLCPNGEEIPQALVAAQRDEGLDYVFCPRHGVRVRIEDYAEEAARNDPRVARIEQLSNSRREEQARLTILPEKIQHQTYDVFLSHNSLDKTLAEALASRLESHGINAWFDKEQMIAGRKFIPVLEDILRTVPAAAVLMGPSAMGPWEEQEYHVLLQRHVEERNAPNSQPFRLIPVILPGGEGAGKEWPPFLRGFDRIDFRDGFDDIDEMRKLIASLRALG